MMLVSRRLSLLIFALALIGASRPAFSDDNPVTIKRIIEVWKAREQKIKSFDFRWWSKHFESEPNDWAPDAPGQARPPARPDATFIVRCRFATDSKDWQVRTRLDDRGRSWVWNSSDFTPRTVAAFSKGSSLPPSDFVPRTAVDILNNGIEQRFLCDCPLGPPALATKTGPGLIDHHDVRSRALRLAYRPFTSPIAVFPAPLTLAKDTDADSTGLVVLDHPDAKVWVDPTKDFLPLRYTKGHPNSLHSELEISYSRDGMLGWVPQSWTSKQFDSTGKEYASDTANVIEYSINKPLPDAVFELDLPVGTHVIDTTSDEEFIVRADGRRVPVSEDEAIR
jgi:hypothetical protein